MFKLFKFWKVMSEARKAKIKKRAWIISFLSFGFACFGLGYGLYVPINKAFEGKPGLVWGLVSTLIVLFLLGIMFFIFRRITRPMREKRKLRQLEQTKLEHELDVIENEKNKALEEQANDKVIE